MEGIRILSRIYYQKFKEKKNANAKAYYQSHKEEASKYRKKWIKENPDKRFEYHLIKTYFGMTLNQYNELFNKQCGCCAICGAHPIGKRRMLHVDHDHNTGKTRGLLCHTCNILLGGAKDNVDILYKAIDYLTKNKS